MFSHTFSPSRCLALTKHFLYAMKRNPTRLIEILVWPAFEILLFSFLAVAVTHSEDQVLSTGLGIIAGLVFWNFFSRIVQETIAQFMDDVISKNMQNILVTPVTVYELLCGLSLASIIKMMISILFLSLLILGIYPSLFTLIGVVSLAWIAILVLYAISLSFVGVALIILFGTRLSFIGSLLSISIQVIACAFYPRTVLPPVLYQLSFLVPASYVFESIREFLVTSVANTSEFLIASIMLLFTLVLSILFFQFAFDKARSTASLTKI